MSHLTAADVLDVARREVGITENPPGSNRQKYGEAFGWNGVSWCGIYVWWCFFTAGADLRKHGFPARTCASTNAFDAAAAKAGWQRIAPGDEQPGDIALYDFGVVGPGDSPNDDDHMGLVVSNLPGAYLSANEGNTSSGIVGSQSNGGGVFVRTRPYHLVRHLYRPPWADLPGDSVALSSDDITKIAKAVAAQPMSPANLTAVADTLLAHRVPLTKAAAEAMTAAGAGAFTEGELVSVNYLIQWGGGGLYRVLGEGRARGKDIKALTTLAGTDPKTVAADVLDGLAARMQS